VKHDSPFRRFRNVSIAKKLYFVVGVMTLLIGVELFMVYFSLNTLSSLRAYVGGEGLWSKAQKDAVFHLYKYGVSHTDHDYVLFNEFMRVPIGDGQARQELLKIHPDMAKARQGFIEGRNHPDDVEGMIDLFTRFNTISYIDRAIRIWGEAEPIALQLMPIAEDLRKEIESDHPSQDHINKLLDDIDDINTKLTDLEDAFSYTLGEGSRWLEGIVLRLLFAMVLTVEITGLLLAISINRRIHRGLSEIIRATTAFAHGTYEARANIVSRDEIGVLASSFNRMSDDLQSCLIDLEKSQRKFKILLEGAPDAMVITDERDSIKLVNAQTEKVFGYSRNELLENSVKRLLPENPAKQCIQHDKRWIDILEEFKGRLDSEIYFRRKDGREFPAEVSVSLLETEEGLLVSAVIRDVSERKHMIARRRRAEEDLRRAYDELRLWVAELGEANQRLKHEVAERGRAEAKLRRAFALLDQHVNNTPLGIIEWEQDRASEAVFRVCRWSGRAQAIFGWTEAEVIGRSAIELGMIYEEDAHRLADSGRDLVKGHKRHNSMSLRCYTKHRRIRHCQWYNSAIHPEDSDKTTILSLVEDVTERMTAMEDVYRLAHHDTLTGLPNSAMENRWPS
jgi:PAS domain S-box-containing protein